jgi:hypothetical protein
MSLEPTIARMSDRLGREVLLLERIWQLKILRDHPEMIGHLEAVVATVQAPEHLEPDATARRERLYRRDVGPSRWLLVVVSFEQSPGRVITTIGNRKDPRRWKP